VTTPTHPRNEVAVFRPRPQSLIKPTLIAAAATAITVLLSVWRESPAQATPLKVLTILSGGFIAFFGIFWGARLWAARYQTVSILPSGLKGSSAPGYEGFCRWDNITDAQVIRTDGDSYIRVTGRYFAQVHIPLILLENQAFVDLIDRYVPEGSPLSLALRSAGA
jgi:hypothetical protein